MERPTQEGLVDRQFGSQAEAYLNSAVHAGGADLKALVALVPDDRTARVLDLGCGAGHVSFNAAPRVREVVAYDLSQDMLNVVARAASERGLGNVATKQGAVENLPFADASFDAVLCRHTAHHWRDFNAALREAHRVLKPGGIAGFVDAVSPGVGILDTFMQAIELLRDPSHVRDYSHAEWSDALERAGFFVDGTEMFRIRLDFASWIARMRTPKVQADAIRALEQAMPENVARYFNMGADGSFDLDIAFVRATKRV
jgi:ubiquinone/menaquinone biosynthesis C-methylase UbiE